MSYRGMGALARRLTDTFMPSKVTTTDRTKAKAIFSAQGVGWDREPGTFPKNGVQNSPSITTEMYGKFLRNRRAGITDEIIQLKGDGREEWVKAANTFNFSLRFQGPFNQDALIYAGQEELTMKVL